MIPCRVCGKDLGKNRACPRCRQIAHLMRLAEERKELSVPKPRLFNKCATLGCFNAVKNPGDRCRKCRNANARQDEGRAPAPRAPAATLPPPGSPKPGRYSCACGCGANVTRPGARTRKCAGLLRQKKTQSAEPARPGSGEPGPAAPSAKGKVERQIRADAGEGVVGEILGRHAEQAVEHARAEAQAGHYDYAANLLVEAAAIRRAQARLA
jgi:hypothetical protein